MGGVPQTLCGTFLLSPHARSSPFPAPPKRKRSSQRKRSKQRTGRHRCSLARAWTQVPALIQDSPENPSRMVGKRKASTCPGMAAMGRGLQRPWSGQMTPPDKALHKPNSHHLLSPWPGLPYISQLYPPISRPGMMFMPPQEKWLLRLSFFQTSDPRWASVGCHLLLLMPWSWAGLGGSQALHPASGPRVVSDVVALLGSLLWKVYPKQLF